MIDVSEYQESPLDNIFAPLRSYRDAQLNLYILHRKTPLPPDYEIRKAMYQAQMLAAEIEMKKMLYPE